jgi:phosphoserine phosphatase
LRESLAFGDSAADLPILLAVGRPVVVNARAAFHDDIAARGWPQYGEDDDVAGALPVLLARPSWNEPRLSG